MRRISVVIVTWNSRDVVAGCLDALAAHPAGTDLEVIVVDNGSTDGTVELLQQRADLRCICNERNRGLPAANNQGIAVATGDAVLIANPDTRVGGGAIRALADLLDRHPRAAIAVPRLTYEDGALQTSAGDLPSLAETVLGRQAQRRRAATSGFWWDGWSHDHERRIGRGHEACYLVRRAAIDEVGPQDERFTLDYEGIDWTERMVRAGWEVWFTPAAAVVHLGGTSSRQVPVRWVVRQHRGMYRYFATRRPRWARPLLAVLFTARALAKLGGMAVGLSTYERGHRRAPDTRSDSASA